MAALQIVRTNLRIELYADGANVRDTVAARGSGLTRGFTTNPTLMLEGMSFDTVKMLCNHPSVAGFRL